MSHLRLVRKGDREPAPVDALTPDRKNHLRSVVHKLPADERRVTLAHFFENRDLASIADEMGVSEAEVREVRERALRLLKRATAFS